MKNSLNFFLFAAIVFLFSCGDGNENTNAPLQDTTPADTVTATKPDTLPIEARLCGCLLSIANHIDSSGFSCDSARLTKVYTELNGNKKLYGRGHTFYLCDRSETCISTAASMSEAHGLVAWFDSTYDYKDEPVIEYFFTDAGSGGFYNDGIIEQWKFVDASTAFMAAEKIVLTHEVSVTILHRPCVASITSCTCSVRAQHRACMRCCLSSASS